jgi:hypothetical protein
MTGSILIAATAVALVSVTPSVPEQHSHAPQRAAMDHRGQQAMGFDQAKVRHTFATADNGGTIEVVAKDAKDSETVIEIRGHLRQIARLFKAGDFSKPLFIHAQDPPGVDVMKARRADIEYRYEERPAGGTVTVSSKNADAIAAIHAFLRFQQGEHKR